MTPADRYAAWLPEEVTGAREDFARRALPTPPELEIQARWFSGEFGRTFFTVEGGSVEIVQFGVWNREAGPDFSGAAVSIDGGPPRRGCIELDPDARDWTRHGHARNPAYEEVVLHVSWNGTIPHEPTRTLAGRAVPRVQLDLARLDRTALNSIPYAKPGRCCAPLAVMDGSGVKSLLLAAAHYRIRRKAGRLRQAAEIHGSAAALFQGVAEALGSKSNKLPFLLLAQRVRPGPPLNRRGVTEAVLFGVSGFLRETDLAACREDARVYLRGIWDSWWPRRGEYDNLTVPSGLWKCGGVRPLNHPHRRIGALGELARRWKSASAALRSAEPDAIGRFFAGLSHPYWDHHCTLGGMPSPRAMALVGPDRASAILMNVALPWAVGEKNAALETLMALRAPDYNLRVKTAALRLFGIEARRVPELKMAVHQQGLLQIYEDFCCQDVSDCMRCRLPEQLKQWQSV